MRRREFIALVGGALAASALAARAQPTQPMRRIAIISMTQPDDPGGRFAAAFEQELNNLGWTFGRNLDIDRRWGALDPEVRARHSREVVALKPDVILAVTPVVVASLQQETRTIPIVFVDGTEKGTANFIADWSHPGGNVTGFINFVDSIFGKWVQLLKDVAPQIDRLAYIFNSPNGLPINYSIADLETAARAFNIQVSAAHVRDSAAIETAIAALAGDFRGGAIVLPGPFVATHRHDIIDAAARHKVPVIYPFPYYAGDGGLLAFGVNEFDLFRRSAGYVDKILRGAGPRDLPVQAPEKFELVVNRKTAQALGVQIPNSLLATADQVIE